MKKRGLLAVFLVATMLLSAMPAFAAEGNIRQIIKSSEEMLPGEQAADGLVSVNAQALPTNEENLFRVRLDVMTSEDLKEMSVQEGDAAVLIIVDKSTSMNHNGPIVQDVASLENVLARYPQLGLDSDDFPVTTQYKDGVLEGVDEVVNKAVEAVLAEELAARLALEEELKRLEEEQKKEEALPEELPEEGQQPEDNAPAGSENDGETDSQPEDNAPAGSETDGETDSQPEENAPAGSETDGETDSQPEDSAPAGSENGGESDSQPEDNAPAVSENDGETDSQQPEDNAPAGVAGDSQAEAAGEVHSASAQLVHQSSGADYGQMDILAQVRDCYHYRAWFERQAVMDFLDGYTSGITEDVSRYFALGTFHQDASIKADWTKLGAEWSRNGNVASAVQSYNYNQEAWTTQTGTDSKLTYTNGSGTNVAGAYLLARNMMHVGFDPNEGAFRQEGIENLQVILITDGEPSYGLDTSKYADINDVYYGFVLNRDEQGAIESYQLNNNAKIHGVHAKTPEELAAAFAELEMIASTVARDELFTLNAVRYGNSERQSLFDGNSAAYCDNYEEVDDASLAELVMSGVFQQTVPPVSTTVYPWTVTLPMGQFMGYEGAFTSGGAFAANKTDFSGNSLIWDLTRSQPQSTEETETGKQYFYQYEFLTRLDNTQSGFVDRQAYDVAGTTTLGYHVKTESDGNIVFTEGSIDFDVPQVEGYLSQLVFDKVDGNGAALGGAAFTLTLDEDGDNRQIAQSGADRKVRFSVPSGHGYTLAETQAPEGYNGSVETYGISVSYGDLQITQGDTVIESLRVVNTAIPGFVPDPTPDPTPDPIPDPGPEFDPTPAPEPETEIPETDVPLTDNPLTDIPEEEVPLADLPPEETEIPEEEVPLGDVPQTGDTVGPWGLLSAASGAGLLWLLLSDKKRRDAEAR